jgi:hypothetical protein
MAQDSVANLKSERFEHSQRPIYREHSEYIMKSLTETKAMHHLESFLPITS